MTLSRTSYIAKVHIYNFFHVYIKLVTFHYELLIGCDVIVCYKCIRVQETVSL